MMKPLWRLTLCDKHCTVLFFFFSTIAFHTRLIRMERQPVILELIASVALGKQSQTGT